MSTTTYPYLNSLGHYVQPVLISKWGQMDLGYCPGGVKLLFTESLDGVIKWSVATWLFAVNKVFMQAFFDKDKTPIKFFFSKAGLAQLSELMVHVLRWGLWMSPIIYTFLRMMPNPTWYNQDGAIRTLFAIYNNLTMSAPAFVAWSLKMFIWILAFDFFRILIWMDHMGLRVATLVNFRAADPTRLRRLAIGIGLPRSAASAGTAARCVTTRWRVDAGAGRRACSRRGRLAFATRRSRPFRNLAV